MGMRGIDSADAVWARSGALSRWTRFLVLMLLAAGAHPARPATGNPQGVTKAPGLTWNRGGQPSPTGRDSAGLQTRRAPGA